MKFYTCICRQQLREELANAPAGNDQSPEEDPTEHLVTYNRDIITFVTNFSCLNV